jgi:hypothetical protein
LNIAGKDPARAPRVNSSWAGGEGGGGGGGAIGAEAAELLGTFLLLRAPSGSIADEGLATPVDAAAAWGLCGADAERAEPETDDTGNILAISMA